jgi:hypothetical protein
MGHPSQAFYDAIDKHFSKSEQKQLFVKIDDILPYIEDDEQIFPENFRKIGLYRAKEQELVIIKNPDVTSEEWITARFAKKEVFRDLTKMHDFKLIVFRNIDFTEDFFKFTEGYFEHLSDGVSLCFINCKIESFPTDFFSIKYSELEFRDSEINHMIFSSIRARSFYINDTIIHELNSTDGISCHEFSIAFSRNIHQPIQEYFSYLLTNLKLKVRQEIYIFVPVSMMSTFSPQFCTLLLDCIESREVASRSDSIRVHINSYRRISENTVKFPNLDPYYYEPQPIDDEKFQYIYWIPYSDYTTIDTRSNSILIDLTNVEVNHNLPITFRLEDITKVPRNIEYFKNLLNIGFSAGITNFKEINVSAFKTLKFFRAISIHGGTRFSDRLDVIPIDFLQSIKNFIKSYEFRKLNIEITEIHQSFNQFKREYSRNRRTIHISDEVLLELLKPEIINIDILPNLRRLISNEKINIKIESEILTFLEKIYKEYPNSKFDFDMNTITIFFK